MSAHINQSSSDKSGSLAREACFPAPDVAHLALGALALALLPVALARSDLIVASCERAASCHDLTALGHVSSTAASSFVAYTLLGLHLHAERLGLR